MNMSKLMDELLLSTSTLVLVDNDAEMGMSDEFQKFLLGVEQLKEVITCVIESRDERLDSYFEKNPCQKKFVGGRVSVTNVERRNRKMVEGVVIPEELTTVEVKLNNKALDKYVKENGALPQGIEESVTYSYRVKVNEQD